MSEWHDKAERLADDYARHSASWYVESLYGTSKTYTAEKARELDAARAALLAHLRTAQPVAQEAVAFAKDGSLFWYGEHKRGASCDLYAAPVAPLVAQEAEGLPARAKRVIDAARAAVDDEAGKDRYLDDLICIPSHRAAALSLALDEYDASPVASQVRAEALEEAARWVDKRCDDYDAEHGSTDPDTGAREYPGDGEEYVGELQEIAEGIRALKEQP